MEICAHIAFEGPIAAGKTTLATMLAAQINADLVLEDFGGNEFLSDFYADQNRWSLPMQLWFMSTRYQQLDRMAAPSFRSVVVDYSKRKDSLFARLLLRDRELRLFEQLAAAIPNGPTPDLIVYLDARNEVLLQRIRSRGRTYEAAIDGCYLDSLRRAYDIELAEDQGLNVLRYDTSELDLNSDAQMRQLYEGINASVPSIPLGKRVPLDQKS